MASFSIWITFCYLSPLLPLAWTAPLVNNAQALLLEDERALLQIRNSLQSASSKVASALSDWSASINGSSSSNGSPGVNNADSTASTNHPGSIISPCSWSRVTCNPILTRVTGLDLSSLSISGALSPGFSNLTALTHLNLSNNMLIGAVSNDIASCTELVSLDLSFNSFSSFDEQHQPQGLSMLSKLQFLSLSNNNISADVGRAIPSNCSHLQTLNISNNSFEGLSSPAWQVCTSLQSVDLSHNLLTDTIPPTLAGLQSLQHLVLASNQLRGNVPPFCSTSQSSLSYLDLSENELNGSFPLSVTNCASLQYLELSHNNLTGNISPTVGHLPSLVSLKLAENDFSGPIPAKLGRLTKLQVFMAGSNALEGAIPSELSNCTRLNLLDLSTNKLQGSLPNFLDKMPSLEYIALHSNAFQGSIPSTMFNMSRLRFVDLSNNSLSGSISSQFSNVSTLQFLLLAANTFHGDIPQELGQLVSLQFLDLSSNSLQGSIPSSLGNLQDLLWLMLAHNNLTGEIPSQLGQCTSLLWLNLRSNSLTGQLPEELATMGLDPERIFQYNSRNINPPKALGECLMIKRWIPEDYPPYSFIYDILDRSRCKSFWIELITGSPLASTCGRNPKLLGGYIQVTDNELTGPIPSSLQGNQTSILLLSLNSFTGTLPAALGNLPLVYLNASHNNLSGSIPDTLADNQCFTLLDLAYNNLSGSLPRSLGTLSQLSKFNVSYNPLLTGSIPSIGQFLTFDLSSYINDPLLCLQIVNGSATDLSLPFCNSSSNSLVNSVQNATGNTTKQLSTKFFLAIGILSTSAGIFFGGVGLYVIRQRWYEYTQSYKGVDDKNRELETCHKGSEVTVMKPAACFFDKQGGSISDCSAMKNLKYADILVATNNFDEENIVGCGGFGVVYKAVLADGSTVAIKKLAHQDPQGHREFLAEMETVGTIVHESLVPLLGCYLSGHEKLLVYKFMCNGSLDNWLHGHEAVTRMEELTWSRRLNVARNCAKALSFLHHECRPVLIHRDIKASNILLDERFNGYLADFGLAREMEPGNSHVSTVLAGTLGYVPPEYSQTWRATTKGDVYSFGVVMLELITGRKPIRVGHDSTAFMSGSDKHHGSDAGNLVEWVRGLMKQDKTSEAIHLQVKQSAQAQKEQELMEFIELAMTCTLEVPELRPSMREVASALDRMIFNQPRTP